MFTDDPDLWQFLRFGKPRAARTMDGYENLTIRGTRIDPIVDAGLLTRASTANQYQESQQEVHI